jgi:hypothetical protein
VAGRLGLPAIDLSIQGTVAVLDTGGGDILYARRGRDPFNHAAPPLNLRTKRCELSGTGSGEKLGG